MRAKEFTINVPITITINGDDDPVVGMTGQTGRDDTKLQSNPVMVSPQQQELELKKAEAGKISPVIDKLTGTETIGQEPAPENEIIQKLKAILNK